MTTELNLPHYPVKMGGTQERPTIFDVLRRKYVVLTPEEWVRQHFIHYLIGHKGYPATLLANEVQLRIGGKSLRADSVLYNRDMRPLAVMEYKAPNVALTAKVFEQITAYNTLLRVSYLIVSNGLTHYCCQMDPEQKKYHFMDHIPSYGELRNE